MKAIVFEDKLVAPKVLDRPDPKPGTGEILIGIQFAALNHRDLWIHKGMYAGLNFPVIPGSDGAGIVLEVGEGCSDEWVGKQVLINPSLNWGNSEHFQEKDYQILGMPSQGTFAEKIVVSQEQVVEIPDHLSPKTASALPLAGLTGFRALFSRGGLRPGERVLITGIGGGVAQLCLDMALAIGAQVCVTSGDQSKIDKAITKGAIGGSNYKVDGWHKEMISNYGMFDLIIDSAGGEQFGKLVDLADFGGRIVIYGGTAGKLCHLSPQKIFWKQLSIMGSTMGSPSDFRKMIDYVASHKVIPEVDTVFPMHEVSKAFERMDSGLQTGKIVISIP